MESEKHGGSTVSTLNLLRAGSLHTDEQRSDADQNRG
jgi:hypothetical protein